MKRFLHLLFLLLPAGAAALTPSPLPPDRATDATEISAAGTETEPVAEGPASMPMHDHSGLAGECPYRHAFTEPLSMAPLTVHGDSYAACRRMLGENSLPAADLVHVDQLINHFTYDYPEPEEGAQLSFTAEVAPCPWNGRHLLVLFGIRARETPDSIVRPVRHVRLRVEFNPTQVVAYRVVGDDYDVPLSRQKRREAARRGNSLDAGSCTTILYEVIPAEAENTMKQAPALKLEGREGVPVVLIPSSELLAAQLRCHRPESRHGKQSTATIRREDIRDLSGDFAFAAAVAMYGQLLGDSEFRGDATWDKVLALAEKGLGEHPDEQRREFIALVRMARMLDNSR